MPKSKILVYTLGAGILYFGYKKIVNANKKLSDEQHVVIVGGGYGGTNLANKLKGKGNFTLIDQRDAMHHNLSALRAGVEPGFAPKSVIPYKLAYGNNFVQGKVVEIDLETQEVILENNPKRIPFTQLVLATGSRGPFPGKCSSDLSSSEIIKLYENFSKDIQLAKNIVIVGGGAVGVEMAGEIATEYPGQKKITIVHNNTCLVSPVLNDKARKIIDDKFKMKEIGVVLSDKVTNLTEIPVNCYSDSIKVKLESGKSLEADLVIPCYGLTVNTDAYKISLANSMDAKGQLKVDDWLRVEGTKNIYAIGDCNNCDVTKLALMAQEQATYMFNSLVEMKKNDLLEPYWPSTFKICVPIGRDGGFVQSGNSFVLGDFLAKKIKGQDLFVTRTWKECGLKPPQ